MNKAIIIFALLVILCAYAEATKPKCRPICKKHEPSKIKCVRGSKSCRKMKQCSIEEENCRRRLAHRRPLTVTSSSRCRDIKGALGAGPCAAKHIRKPRNVRPDCRHIKCTHPRTKPKCYRSRKNNCQLLTACQLKRVNCQRGHKNHLIKVDHRKCRGMKSGEKLQKCRRIPKKV